MRFILTVSVTKPQKMEGTQHQQGALPKIVQTSKLIYNKNISLEVFKMARRKRNESPERQALREFSPLFGFCSFPETRLNTSFLF